MRTSRRSFLRKVGATAIGTTGVFLALPSPEESPTVESTAESAAPEAPRHPYDDATIDDEDASPIARWQYHPAGDEYVPTSPINVVFPLADVEEGLEDVMAVLEDRGWLRRPEEYARYAWDRDRERWVLQEATAAETYYGTSGRAHVRCWEFEGVVSMQAHDDSRANPKHGIASYERAREAIETTFASAGWRVDPASIDLGNAAEPDHDGRATAIWPAPVDEPGQENTGDA